MKVGKQYSKLRFMWTLSCLRGNGRHKRGTYKNMLLKKDTFSFLMIFNSLKNKGQTYGDVTGQNQALVAICHLQQIQF